MPKDLTVTLKPPYRNSNIFIRVLILLCFSIIFQFDYFYSKSNIFIRFQILLCPLATFRLSANIFMLFNKFSK